MTPLRLAEIEASRSARQSLKEASRVQQPSLATVPSKPKPKPSDIFAMLSNRKNWYWYWTQGRKAGLTNPEATCPYTGDGIDRESWLRGQGEGQSAAARYDPLDRAWSQGWHCGAYAPNARCPYPAYSEERIAWTNGLEKGAKAVAEIIKEEKAKKASRCGKKAEKKARKAKKPAKPPAPQRAGRTAKSVTEVAEMRRIWLAKRTMSFKKVEDSFGLRSARGMTAHRIYKKYENMTGEAS
jgi:ribosome modulation factor